MEQGRFRPDLYYRLNMLKFAIPPLRRRKLDIISLARKFICQFAIQHGIRVEEIDDTLFNAIMDYPWLGNVRELQHVIQRSVIYCSDGRLSAEQLPQYLLSETASPPNGPTVPLTLGLKNPCSPPLIPKNKTLGGQIALSEKEIIEHSLFNNSFIRNKTAKDLGISRVTLYNKMKKYGMMK
jgi:DNA-binding NtrC family response regulator